MSDSPAFFRPIGILARREWFALFRSPLAWTLLGVTSAMAGFMFYSALSLFQAQKMQFQMYGSNANLSLTQLTVGPTFGNVAIILMLLIPLLTMRLVAEEKRRNTWEALVSSPLSPLQIVLGKYLGFLLFLAVLVGLLSLMPLTLFLYGNPDKGQVFTTLLGLFLLAGSFGAVGLAASCATENPVVAAILSFGTLLLLWILGWSGDSTPVGTLFNYLCVVPHFESFLKGVISSADLAYFLLLSSAGLLVARQRLLAQRYQN
ncbi:MAG: ABC transporter permease [Magnetococcales bacterium]|nr:ABC transporter permease [Magnetococcales bacterium]